MQVSAHENCVKWYASSKKTHKIKTTLPYFVGKHVSTPSPLALPPPSKKNPIKTAAMQAKIHVAVFQIYQK